MSYVSPPMWFVICDRMASTGAEVTSGTQYINYFLSTILLSLRPIKVFIIKQPHRCLSGSLSGSLWPPSKKELAPQPPLLKLLPRKSPFPELGLRNETRVSTTQVRLRTLLRQMLNVFAYRMTHLKICFI